MASAALTRDTGPERRETFACIILIAIDPEDLAASIFCDYVKVASFAIPIEKAIRNCTDSGYT